MNTGRKMEKKRASELPYVLEERYKEKEGREEDGVEKNIKVDYRPEERRRDDG